jgi:hypothetical protein
MDTSGNNKATVLVYYKCETADGGTSPMLEKDKAEWQAVRENNIWKIKAVFEK